MNTKEKTIEFLNQMPEVNSATAYGSGFFKQNGADPNEKKSMDLILSVDNPNEWHTENLAKNRQMYQGSGLLKLTSIDIPDDTFSFPKSIGCFFTEYEGTEYKCLVVDKRLLYDDLKRWSNFSLAGRFQKETETLIDNSNKTLSKLLEENYEKAILTARLMITDSVYNLETLFEEIVRLSYMGDIRTIAHLENRNKIPNIVNGSYEFFKMHYTKGLKIENDIIIDDIQLEEIYNLPPALKNYLLNTLSDQKLKNKKAISKQIKTYFRNTDFISSIELAIRCNQTVGLEKTLETLVGKAKKGFALNQPQKKLKKHYNPKH